MPSQAFCEAVSAVREAALPFPEAAHSCRVAAHPLSDAVHPCSTAIHPFRDAGHPLRKAAPLFREVESLFRNANLLIGYTYRLHYEDGSTESIPIAYGQDVRDWWTWEKPAEVTRGKIAWTGKNSFSRQQNQSIHLYLTTWSNPHPEKKVSSLDYICTGTSAASPFCIAISIEEK